MASKARGSRRSRRALWLSVFLTAIVFVIVVLAVIMTPARSSPSSSSSLNASPAASEVPSPDRELHLAAPSPCTEPPSPGPALGAPTPSPFSGIQLPDRPLPPIGPLSSDVPASYPTNQWPWNELRFRLTSTYRHARAGGWQEILDEAYVGEGGKLPGEEGRC